MKPFSSISFESVQLPHSYVIDYIWRQKGFNPYWNYKGRYIRFDFSLYHLLSVNFLICLLRNDFEGGRKVSKSPTRKKIRVCRTAFLQAEKKIELIHFSITWKKLQICRINFLPPSKSLLMPGPSSVLIISSYQFW